MIAMLDQDHNGTLNFEEFKNLWNIVNGWKQIFVQADRGMAVSGGPWHLRQRWRG